MNRKAHDIMIYVPDGAFAAPLHADDLARRDSIGEVIGKVTIVSSDEVEDQWNDTLDVLLNLGDAISKRAAEWKIDEIEVGLTLSAKGHLLFIAEAGAESSIKLKLKPKV